MNYIPLTRKIAKDLKEGTKVIVIDGLNGDIGVIYRVGGKYYHEMRDSDINSGLFVPLLEINDGYKYDDLALYKESIDIHIKRIYNAIDEAKKGKKL